jgi:hypothetical protein
MSYTLQSRVRVKLELYKSSLREKIKKYFIVCMNYFQKKQHTLENILKKLFLANYFLGGQGRLCSLA